MKKLVVLAALTAVLAGCAATPPDERYLQAIQQNDPGTLQSLAAEGFAFTLPEGESKAPLHIAIDSGSTDVINFLVSQGENLNQLYQGDTPLMRAALQGDEAMIRQLIAAGADVNFAPEPGVQAITRLSESNAALAPLLVNNRTELAAVKSQLHPKRHPKLYAFIDQGIKERQALLKQLDISLQRDDVAGIRQFLSSGYSANAEIGNDTYVLERAVSYNAIRSMRLLLEEPTTNPDQANSKGITALHKAAFFNRDNIIQLLLDHGADPDPQTLPQLDRAMRGTPLMVAARHGRINAIRALLAGGANPNQLERWGNAAIHIINSRDREAIRDYTPVVQALAIGGADLNLRSEKGETALTLAQHTDAHPEVIETLLEYGADVNLADQNGTSPLHIAVLKRKPAQVQQLIAAGADLEAQYSARTLTALLQVSARRDYQPQDSEITEQLLKAGANTEAVSAEQLTPLMYAVLNSKRGISRLLLAGGADPDARGKNGYTALHYAVEQGNPDIARLLLEAQHRPDQRLDTSGTTPLGMAAAMNDARLVRLLLEGGHSPVLADNKGKSPLHAVLENFDGKDTSRVVEMLLEGGASNSALTNSGISPLMLGCITGKLTAVVKLVEAGADIEMQNPVHPQHYTAVNYAEMNNQYDILAYLITHLEKQSQ